LRALIDGAPAAALDFREKENAWSFHHVLCHLS
jgi:hypothetical protein